MLHVFFAQVELVGVREKYEASMSELLASRREGDQLKHALDSLQSKLQDYQRKDAEVGTGGGSTGKCCI